MSTYKTSTALNSGEKVSIVGDSAVGKTTMIIRYIQKKFETNLNCTVGFE